MTLKLAFESGSEILYVDIRESVALEKTTNLQRLELRVQTPQI